VSLEKTRQKRAINFTRPIENLTVGHITDVFNRAMDSSDPLLSSLCLRDRSKFGKKKLLPKEVIHILQNPDAELYKSSYHSNNEEEEVEVEDEFNCLNIFLEKEVEE